MGERSSRWAIAALVGVVLLALGLRALGFEHVFLDDGTVVLELADAQYHARRALWTLYNYPTVLTFDPYINYPKGAPVPWPPLYDFTLASLTLLLDGTQRTLERVAAGLPVVLGALTVLPVYALGRRVHGPGVGIGAGALYATLQIAVNYARVGDADHHAAVGLIGACLVALYAAVLDAPARGAPVVRLFGALLAMRVALLLTWQGSLFYLGLGELAIVAYSAVRGRRDLLIAQALTTAATAVAIAPVVLSTNAAIGGPYSAVELSRLHLVAFGAAAAVAAGLAALESWRPAGSGTTRLARSAVLAALAGAAAISFAEPREGILRAFEWMTKSDAFAELVAENRPLFGNFSREWRHWSEHLVGYYGYLIPLVPIAFVLRARRRSEAAPALFLAAWAAFSGALFLSQIRYGNDFAAVGCVGFALLLAASADGLGRIVPRARRWAPVLAVAAGVVLLLPVINSAHIPKLRGTWNHLSGRRPPGDLALWSIPGSALRFAEAVRSATPATDRVYQPNAEPEYAILTLPLYGHVLHYGAQRATPADNFGIYIGRESFHASRRFYLEIESEAEAVETARALGARYFVTFEPFGNAPARTVVDLLHRHDGSARRDRAHLGRFRLVTEGPRGGLSIGAMFGAGADRRGTPYKLYEVVEGAVLDVAAAPGETVRAQVRVRTPAGRTFRFLAVTKAGADGRAQLRVPYPTPDPQAAGGAGSDAKARAVGPYRVQTGGERLLAEVAESDVLGGNSIRVDVEGR